MNKSIIEKIWKKKNINGKEKKIIKKCIKKIGNGKIRVMERKKKKWKFNKWVKKAIIMFFRTSKKKIKKDKNIISYDIFNTMKEKHLIERKIRASGMSFIREGAYVAKNVVLMPSFVNIGAYIDEKTMLDTWSTVGSCAQIGKNVHISGGAGIGGVLEPIQNKPVIIEDNCFIGARSEIVEGTIVKEGSIISMGVYIGKSTKIYDRSKDLFYKSYVPKNSVVVPGSLNYGKYSLYTPVIVKKKNKDTIKKIKMNKNLRNV
ncbi:tetrahydrodipicolinate N-succinyltransferase [Candidatus Vidania fulgoroideae]|nr:tetrahydrodipicolinate N-succinyltransferase [Candidatus Vidania fulgoroideae]